MRIPTAKIIKKFDTDGVTASYSLAGVDRVQGISANQYQVVYVSPSGISDFQIIDTDYSVIGDPLADTAALAPVAAANWAAGGTLNVVCVTRA